jgi:hypothetical protein
LTAISPTDDYAAARAKWLAETENQARRPYSLLHLSSHGLLLQADVRRSFLAGAWASAIVMAQAVTEATLRDLQTQDYDSKAKALFFGQEDLERMRSLRNELVHPQAPGTASLVWVVPNGDYVACHANLEADAKRAYELMLEAIYANSEA